VPISPRLKSIALNATLLVVVTSITLAVVDVALITTGLLPPPYTPGNPVVGWVSAEPSAAMQQTSCVDFSTGRVVSLQRNEDGVRTTVPKARLLGPGSVYEIVVSGDSHTELCAENERTHAGFTAQYLSGSGVPAEAYQFGSGKYSPLQAYLAIEPFLQSYQPDAFVLNLYSGNDFYDMLRIDDRPHFAGAVGSYTIAPPVWYTLDAPGDPPKSRVRAAARQLAAMTGAQRVMLRIQYLRDLAAREHQGAGVVWNYMNDLRRSANDEIGYPQAYTAQMLNQQLFFHHFPGSREESVARVRHLLALIRSRHPDVLLVLSPIPSYQLVVKTPTDSGMQQVLRRLPLTYAGGVAEEEALYNGLRELARDAGWVFVDNLTPLRAVASPDSLYNHFDYHIEPSASALIGRAQAAAIDSVRRARASEVPQ
jgi:hypothetical protein